MRNSSTRISSSWCCWVITAGSASRSWLRWLSMPTPPCCEALWSVWSRILSLSTCLAAVSMFVESFSGFIVGSNLNSLVSGRLSRSRLVLSSSLSASLWPRSGVWIYITECYLLPLRRDLFPARITCCYYLAPFCCYAPSTAAGAPVYSEERGS